MQIYPSISYSDNVTNEELTPVTRLYIHIFKEENLEGPVTLANNHYFNIFSFVFRCHADK
jgi:hypothetical protein